MNIHLKISISLALVLCSYPASAQKSDILKPYIEYIREHVMDSVVLPMSDTLFQMAGDLGDTKRQAMALAFRADYYYYNEKEDSLKASVARVKSFSKENGHLRYYFYSWQRLVYHYIDMNFLTYALRETDLMMVDAIHLDYYPAQVDVEKLKGRMYMSRGMYQEAKEAFQNAVTLEQNAPRGVVIDNSHSIYAYYVQALFELKEYDNVEELLNIALSRCVSNNQRTNIYTYFCKYYQKIGYMDMVEVYLDKAKQIQDSRTNIISSEAMLVAEISIQNSRGNYEKALELADIMSANSYSPIDNFDAYISIYQNMKQYDKANEYLVKKMDYLDSIRMAEIRDGINEQMVMLDVNQMKMENYEMEAQMKIMRLKSLYWIIAVLILTFLISTFLWIRSIRLNRSLKASEKVKTDFLQHLSHEIRTPLNSIVGFSEVLSEEVQDNEELKKYSEVIHGCSEQLIKLVNDAVDITDDKRMKSEKEMTDINSCYNAALQSIHMPLSEKVSITFIPYGGNSSILIYRIKVIKVLANLIHNAAKFTKEGTITVQATIFGKEVIFTVTDTGRGVPTEQQNTVFEYFTKLDSMSQGLGLGLPLSRAIAESIGGSLTIDKEYTKGCRMIFRFPC